VKPGRIAVIAIESPSGIQGGAERFYQGLVSALNAVDGVQAGLVSVAVDETTFDGILEGYLRCYDLDVSAYDGVISTEAPSYLIRHANHVCYLVHTLRALCDMFDHEYLRADETLKRQRALIHQLDTAALRPPHVKAIFNIGLGAVPDQAEWPHIASQLLGAMELGTGVGHQSVLEIEEAGATFRNANQRLQELQSDNQAKTAALFDIHRELEQRDQRIRDLQAELAGVYRSRSYRITAPLRVIFGFARLQKAKCAALTSRLVRNVGPGAVPAPPESSDERHFLNLFLREMESVKSGRRGRANR
jgi:hypothetical protein